jgi:peptide/nickel transport system substrate-binding protein
MLGIFGDSAGVGRYVVSLLDRLDYRAHLRDLSSDPTAVGRFADSRSKAQVAVSGYFPNYPRPSEFIQWFLSCKNFVPNSTYNANWSELCDPKLDAQIRRALAAERTNSPAAPSLWAAADRIATRDGALVPLVNPSTFNFVSSRLGNYQNNPQLGIPRRPGLGAVVRGTHHSRGGLPLTAPLVSVWLDKVAIVSLD